MSAVYYVVAGLTILLSLLAENQARVVEIDETVGRKRYVPNRFFAISLATVLIYVAGFRYYVGSDYGAYYHKYTGGWSAFLQRLLAYDEPGILAVSTIARMVYDNGISVIFFAALITIGLYVRTIYQYSRKFSLSMILYLFMGAWCGCFNGVRQYLAAAILFAGHRFIVERKLRKYLVIVFLASLFHTTAWIMIVPYFLFARVPSKGQILLLILGTVAVRYSYDLIFKVIGNYKEKDMVMNSYMTNSINIWRIAVTFAPVLLYLIMCRKGNHSKEEDVYINAILFNAFAMMGAMKSTYLGRVGIYTTPMAIIGYSYLISLIPSKRNQKIIMLLIVVLYFFYWRYEVSGSQSLCKFQWWFSIRG